MATDLLLDLTKVIFSSVYMHQAKLSEEEQLFSINCRRYQEKSVKKISELEGNVRQGSSVKIALPNIG
jgi:hypothetical protein